MEVNKIHNINFLDNTLPDKCAKLIIADPPYFEVKGDFDFIWKSFNNYLQDVEKWAIECKRLLADNGTLFWYGHAKNIAYAQVIFDMHFNLINNLVWDKGSFMGLEESEGLRSFAPCTERILMYGSKAQDNTGLDYVKAEFVSPNNPISIYMKQEMKTYNITQRQIAKLFPSVTGGLTGCVHNWLNGDGRAITQEHYEKIQLNFDYAFKKPYEELKKEYEELRKEYEELRRPFANYFKLQEIFRFSNEAVKTGAKYDHDTVKPETLTRALIMTCSRVNDLVVVPFAGSGTECAMSVKENRKTIGFEITEKHAKMSNDRVQSILRQPSLFVGS
jgi:site-specific DNA-methyltransferase (adenine-specific)